MTSSRWYCLTSFCTCTLIPYTYAKCTYRNHQRRTWYVGSSRLLYDPMRYLIEIDKFSNRPIILRQLELLCYLLLLLLSSCTPLVRSLGSTFHLPHTVSYYLMEKTPALHTGRLSLSWLHYCVAGPQWLHWQGWALHRQWHWLENSNIIMIYM